MIQYPVLNYIGGLLSEKTHALQLFKFKVSISQLILATISFLSYQISSSCLDAEELFPLAANIEILMSDLHVFFSQVQSFNRKWGARWQKIDSML